jgi:tRNA dimethylallyltransferase
MQRNLRQAALEATAILGYYLRSLHSDPNSHLMPVPFYLAGATASGKSAVAMELARLCHGEIVNADAFQLYRGLPLITAQPSMEDREKVPHHLFEVLDLTENCDAARYAALARPVIESIQRRGRTPIVTGGSGLYMKALTHGLSDLPQANPERRAEWEAMEPAALVELLRKHDPVSWETVDHRNLRYVMRALEISVLSGRPASTLRTEWSGEGPVFAGAVLQRDREDLHERINRRVLAMVTGGVLEEAMAADHVDSTAGRAIGWREWRAVAEGRCSLEDAILAVQAATRQFAKRQITWFRRETGFRPIFVEAKDDAITVATRLLNLIPPSSDV